jgi:hypothetical protein
LIVRRQPVVERDDDVSATEELALDLSTDLSCFKTFGAIPADPGASVDVHGDRKRPR